MTSLAPEEKRIFIVASPDDKRADYFNLRISRHISNSQIFTARDGLEALFKIENSPPHVVVVDVDLPKLSPIELSAKLLTDERFANTSIIIASPIPDKEHFVDQVVTGQIQFLTDINDDRKIALCLSKALNRLSENQDTLYKLHFLAPEELLFREGETAQCVYIVKKGELLAYKGSGAGQVLGNITVGEFVGEMAHINGEPRSATVRALTDCELIEIPLGSLDTVLFSKPAWSKALVATLSKRLKRTNEALMEKKE